MKALWHWLILGSVELTTQNLEDLNNVKYDDATSALASLGRTINMGCLEWSEAWLIQSQGI